METRTEAPPRESAERHGSAAMSAGVDAAATKPARRLPTWAIVSIGLVLVAALILGIRYLAYATTHETTDDAKIDADTVTISSKIAERVSQVLVDANQPVTKGQILVRLDSVDEQTRLVTARAQRDAQLAQARAAQANVSLTSAQQQAQNEQNSGAIAAARAQITNASANASAAQQQIDAARAAIAGAQAQVRVAQANVPSAREALARANADLSRTASLVRTGDIAQQQLDAQRAAQVQARSQYAAALDNVSAAQTAVTQAQARYTSTIASANAAAAGIGAQQGGLTTAQGRYQESNTPFRVSASEAQASAAQAQVKALDAQVRSAQDQLDYAVIRSPIDGYVGAKNIEIGATVAPGQSLMNIVPKNNIYVTANFKETQLGKIRPGAQVDIKVDAYKGTAFSGKVEAIAPASQNTFSLVPAQNATGNFVKVTQRLPVRIVFTNPPADKPLRVGMSVEASVRTK
ncbi:MAG: EmrA/EmrK family multidrug efflux transporter periplasmic adaptor subunit [Candidatus Velthaea sp.]